MRFHRLFALPLALLLLAVALSACNPLEGEDAQAAADNLVKEVPLPDDNAAQADTTYVGLTENGIGVGVVIDDDAVVAYICDGRALGHWLKGKADDGEIDLTHDAGTRLEAQLDGDIVSGTVTLSDGEQLSFSAEPAVDGISGLFRTTELKDGFVHGWVVLVDDEGLVSVRGVGSNSKTKEIDGSVGADDVDLVDNFDPGDSSSPPVDVAAAGPKGSGIFVPGSFTCDQLEDSWEAIMFTAEHVKSKALQDSYYAMAFEYTAQAGAQGCTWQL